ncbi:MAG: hypothetical protein IJ097_02165 [Bacilli bacterium]|nr:hypothetical protein [Bacilli bacterium]
MKNTIILFIILFIFSLFVKLPKYRELNNLKIIDKLIIKCDKVILREIVPTRDDNGIEYEYKYHIEKSINKTKYYIDKAKIISKCKK